MVTDLKKILKQVAHKKHAWFGVEPMSEPDFGNTSVTIGCIKNDGSEDHIDFIFDADLLIMLTDDDLRDYLIAQIDRFVADQPIQRKLGR